MKLYEYVFTKKLKKGDKVYFTRDNFAHYQELDGSYASLTSDDGSYKLSIDVPLVRYKDGWKIEGV